MVCLRLAAWSLSCEAPLHEPWPLPPRQCVSQLAALRGGHRGPASAGICLQLWVCLCTAWHGGLRPHVPVRACVCVFEP